MGAGGLPPFRLHRISPVIPELSFLIETPESWRPVAIDPEPETDFDDPLEFLPLAALADPSESFLLTVDARPAYGGGDPGDWLAALADAHDLTLVDLIDPGPGPCLAAALLRDGDDAPDSTIIMGLADDGDSLFRIAIHAGRNDMAATQLAKAVLASFLPLSLAERAAAEMPDRELSAFARADNAATLDRNQPLNRQIAQRGMGEVPVVIELDEANCCAQVRLTSLPALLSVPFGWHVIDNGRRVLIFDAADGAEIDLTALDLDDGGIDALLGAEMADAARFPDAEHAPLETNCLAAHGFRGLMEDGKPWARAVIYADAGLGRDRILQVRMGGPAEDFDLLAEFAEVLTGSLEMEN